MPTVRQFVKEAVAEVIKDPFRRFRSLVDDGWFIRFSDGQVFSHDVHNENSLDDGENIAGTYVYPLTSEIVGEWETSPPAPKDDGRMGSDSVANALGMKKVWLFRLIPGTKILWMDDVDAAILASVEKVLRARGYNSWKYVRAQFDPNKQIKVGLTRMTLEEIDESPNKALWAYTHTLSQGDSVTWARLFREAGYDVIGQRRASPLAPFDDPAMQLVLLSRNVVEDVEGPIVNPVRVVGAKEFRAKLKSTKRVLTPSEAVEQLRAVVERGGDFDNSFFSITYDAKFDQTISDKIRSEVLASLAEPILVNLLLNSTFPPTIEEGLRQPQLSSMSVLKIVNRKILQDISQERMVKLALDIVGDKNIGTEQVHKWLNTRDLKFPSTYKPIKDLRQRLLAILGELPDV